MQCDFVAGDVVLYREDHEDWCNSPHHVEEFEWVDFPSMHNKLYRVNSVRPDPEGTCVLITLRDDPIGIEWCWGTFRKLRKADQTVAQMCACSTPVAAPELV